MLLGLPAQIVLLMMNAVGHLGQPLAIHHGLAGCLHRLPGRHGGGRGAVEIHGVKVVLLLPLKVAGVDLEEGGGGLGLRLRLLRLGLVALHLSERAGV